MFYNGFHKNLQTSACSWCLQYLLNPKKNVKLVYVGRIIRERLLGSAGIRWTWVKGHTGNPGNERADRLADMGRESWSNTSRAGSSNQGRALFLMGR